MAMLPEHRRVVLDVAGSAVLYGLILLALGFLGH